MRKRSVYDENGKLLCDLAMGGQVYANMNEAVKVRFTGRDGDAHLWFPTYANIAHLILSSNIRKCTAIKVYHAWMDANHFICEPFDQSVMPVTRTPPRRYASERYADFPCH